MLGLAIYLELSLNIRTNSKQTGANIKIFDNQRTRNRLRSILEESKPALTATYHIFQDWEKFLQLNKEVTENDLLIKIEKFIGKKKVFKNTPFKFRSNKRIGKKMKQKKK